MSNTNRWILRIVYTLIVLVALPWVRAIWNFIGDKTGAVIIILLYAGSVIGYYLYTRKILFIICLSILIALIFIWVPLPVERIHFIEYGIMGWLAYRAGGKKAFIYVIAVGIIDEIIQGILPNRIYDMRDIWMNIIGGGLGMILAGCGLARQPDIAAG